MWETEGVHRWPLMALSHYRGEVGPIRGNAAHYV
jgi:hypothetical protein